MKGIAVIAAATALAGCASLNDIDTDVDNDADDDENDNDNNAPATGVSLEQVSFRPTLQRAAVLNTVLL